MADKNLCPICDTRPSRRSCPALHQEICAVCCGTGREQTVDCPLDCEFLRDARAHEKLPPLDPKSIPNADIELSDNFLHEQRPLAVLLGQLLLIASVETQGAVDSDVRDALAALISTYRTAASGLIYETRPENAIAARVVDRFQADLRKFLEEAAQRAPGHSIRDKEILGMLVFWQRMEYQRNNGRRKGRAFIESLYALLPPPDALQGREGIVDTP